MSFGMGQSSSTMLVRPEQLQAYLGDQQKKLEGYASRFNDLASGMYDRGNDTLDKAFNEIRSEDEMEQDLYPIKQWGDILRAWTPGGFNKPGSYGYNPSIMGYGINNRGGVNFHRGGDVQSYLNMIKGNISSDEAAYSDLLSHINPANSDLTKAIVERLQGERDSAISDLRNQFAQRRINGASFAEQQVQSERERWANAIANATAQGTIQSINMFQSVMGQRTQSRLGYIGQALQQLQFESNLGANIQQNVMGVMANMKQAAASLYAQWSQARSTLDLNMALARASLISNQYMGLIYNTVGERNLQPQYNIQTGWHAMDDYSQYASQAQDSQSSQFSFGLSDRRAKDNIERIGHLNDGTPVYRFTYKHQPGVIHIGLMADEVVPEAVSHGLDGFDYVNYAVATENSVRREQNGN